MADFFCDHGAYGLASNRIGLDAPTWGVPQEGDGTSKDAATASSVASVDLTSITSTAGTFSLFGSSAISAGASASGVTLATQIANAINASTVTTGNTTIFPGAPQLRNAFYARAVGATLEIMCRIGSANTNVLGMVWAGTWSAGPPSSLTFSGGSGGCWGWFLNPTALGVSSSIGAWAYGTMLYVPYAGKNLTLDDQVFVRTGGGESKAISYVGYNLQISKTAGYFPRLVFDTDTVWTGDSAVGTLSLYFEQTIDNGSLKVYLTYGNSTQQWSARCLRRGNFKITSHNLSAGWNQNTGFLLGMEGGSSGVHNIEMFGVELADTGLSDVLHARWFAASNGIAHMRFMNCDFKRTVAKAAIPALLTSGYSASAAMKFDGCTFDLNCVGAGDPGSLISASANVSSFLQFELKNCHFSGYAPGYKIHSGSFWLPTSAAPFVVVSEGCTGLAFNPVYWGMPTATVLYGDLNIHVLSMTLPDGSFRYENQRGVAEWWPSASPAFPTLSSTLPDAVTPWSMRALWVNGVTTPLAPFNLPPLKLYNRNADGVRTITVELMLRSALVVGNGFIDCQINYTDTTGKAVNAHATTLVSSSASWVGAGGWSGYVPVKFEVVTPTSVATNTLVTAQLSFKGNPSSAANEYVFIDPEFEIV